MHTSRHPPIHTVLTLLIVLLTSAVHAESFQEFGVYRIHFNTIQTDFLDPVVASNYGIQRSPKKGLLNIAVRRNQTDTSIGTAAAAEVKAHWSNLNAQVGGINMREVSDRDVIYYIGVFPIRNNQTLSFSVRVRPEGEVSAKEFRFRKKFVVE